MRFILCFFIFLTIFSQAKKLEYPTLTHDIIKDDKFISLLLKVINKQINIDNKIDIRLTSTKNVDEFRKGFSSAKYKIVGLSPMEYLKNKSFYDKYTKERLLPKVNGRFFVEYVLLANKDNPTALTNLENNTIYFPDAFPTGEIWFETVVNKSSKKSKKAVYSAKAHTMVTKVFFNKDHLAIIDKDSYNTLIELNPQIKKKVKVIHKSKPIYFNIVSLVHKKITPEEYEILNSLENNIKVLFEKSTVSYGGEISGARVLYDNELDKLSKVIKPYLDKN